MPAAGRWAAWRPLVLADFGADVIKVEPPGGGPFPVAGGGSTVAARQAELHRRSSLRGEDRRASFPGFDGGRRGGRGVAVAGVPLGRGRGAGGGAAFGSGALLDHRGGPEGPLGRGATDAAAPLFSFDGRRCVNPGTASQVFHHLAGSLALHVPTESRRQRSTA